jgi:ribosomal protein S12 methylthiotransferase
MMYLYSAGITPRLLDVVAKQPRILPYLDMPIQHASDAVLERMRRPERQRTIMEKVARFREAVPDVAIRTTCIVGFPGETEDDFKQLLGFLEEVQFERVGVFPYSSQEGTRAAQLVNDVPASVKRDRVEQLTELQRAITAERYEARLGRTWTAMVDTADEESGNAIARLPWQADDIDGVTSLDETIPPGTLVEVAAQEVVDDYDFRASVIRIVETPLASAPAVPGRPLPMLTTTIGSFGR